MSKLIEISREEAVILHKAGVCVYTYSIFDKSAYFQLPTSYFSYPYSDAYAGYKPHILNTGVEED